MSKNTIYRLRLPVPLASSFRWKRLLWGMYIVPNDDVGDGAPPVFVSSNVADDP